MGSHGTFPVTSVARATSFDVGSSASDVSTTIEPIPMDTVPPWDTVPQWDAMAQQDADLLWDTVPPWDAMAQ